MGSFVASTPGKLILMGEHAVVYGHPALVAALGLRLEARIHLTDGPDVEICLPSLERVEEVSWEALAAYARSARQRWERYREQPSAETFRLLRGEDPAHLVKIALAEAALFLDEIPGPGLRLEVVSDIPIGSGFGSSAATGIAVLAAYLACRGHDPGPEILEPLALEVERRQHGLPSGVDGATVLHGGLVWAEPRPQGGLASTPFAPGSPVLEEVQVFDTGTPAEPTGAVVAAVRERVEASPERFHEVLSRMGATTRRFRELLAAEDGDRPKVIDIFRSYEADLETLGVVPSATCRLIRDLEARGGGAKISGAGALTGGRDGSGAGCLLVYPPETHSRPGMPFRRLPLTLGAPGLRLEQA